MVPGRAAAEAAAADDGRRFGLWESPGVAASVGSVAGSGAVAGLGVAAGGVGAGVGVVSLGEPVRRFQRPATFERKPDSVFMAGGLLDDDVDEFLRDDDDFGDGAGGGDFGDAWGGEGGGLDGCLICVGGYGDFVAQFAIHLDDDFDFIDGEGVGVVGGPWMFAELAGIEMGELRAEAGVDFLGEVWCEGIEAEEELDKFLERHGSSAGEGICADHHLGDGGIEAEFVDVLGDLADGFVDRAAERFIRAGGVGHLAAEDPAAVGFAEGETPDAGEEAADAFHAFHAPWFHLFEGAHEHFVEAQGIGSVGAHDIVWVDDIPEGF